MAQGHGKVILFGEHGVVHGRPALALAVQDGAEVRFEARYGGPTTLHILPWDVRIDTSDVPSQDAAPLQSALKVARALYDDDLELDLHAQMNLPGGAGMGSSAALGVAVLRAMDEARGVQREDAEICERSLAWERVFHGNPSGVDNAMAAHGGVAIFRKGEPIQRIVPRNPVYLVAANSGESSSTKEMVASVARQYERDPERVGKVFDGMASIVSNGRLALEQGNLRHLGQLMQLNHGLLSSLMLSTPTLEDMIRRATEAGALGAKVTGAGGGGCMIALVEGKEHQAQVAAALRGLDKAVYEVETKA